MCEVREEVKREDGGNSLLSASLSFPFKGKRAKKILQNNCKTQYCVFFFKDPEEHNILRYGQAVKKAGYEKDQARDRKVKEELNVIFCIGRGNSQSLSYTYSRWVL